MKTIRGAQIDRFPLSHLKRVRDLESFDGPLISEYISPRGDRYLYYWCDCDSKVNRWMVLRVSGTDILRLAARFIPLDRVIPNGCRDDFVYFVDFDSERIPTNITLTPIDLIPAEYVPAEGAYLSEGVSENPTTFSVILSSNFSLGKLSELPRILSQAYGMMYALDVLKPAKLASYPWRGGFSAMHFYKWILDSLLPAEAKPGIRQWQYASPGFIEFEMDRSVATKVAEIAHDAIG